jgi:hypothetical protein
VFAYPSAKINEDAGFGLAKKPKKIMCLARLTPVALHLLDWKEVHKKD